jgi:hypothetical protein
MKHPGFVQQDIEKYISQLEGLRHKPECWELAIKLTGHIEEAIRILELPLDPYRRRITNALSSLREPAPTAPAVDLGSLSEFVEGSQPSSV